MENKEEAQWDLPAGSQCFHTWHSDVLCSIRDSSKMKLGMARSTSSRRNLLSFFSKGTRYRKMMLKAGSRRGKLNRKSSGLRIWDASQSCWLEGMEKIEQHPV